MARDEVSDALGDELSEGAQFVADGEFSVDIRQAGTKLSAFRLADPGAWIVLLIEGAIAAGCTTIEIAFRRGEIELLVHALSLEASELERFGVVLASAPKDPRSRAHAVYLLSLAFQAAQARVDGILIESGKRRLRWSKAELSEDELGPRADTRVLVELGDHERERELLHERCAYAQIDIWVDREQIAWGWRRAFGNRESPAARQPCIEPELIRIDGQTAGLAGFHFERLEGATWLILMNGVLAERVELSGQMLRRGFVAITEAPELARDLGLAKLVRGPRFAELEAMVEATRTRLHGIHASELDTRARTTLALQATPPQVVRILLVGILIGLICAVVSLIL